MQEKVGTVQGEAEADAEQARRDQRHPGAVVSVVSMDVLHIEWREFVRQGSAEEGVHENPSTLLRARALLECGLQHWLKVFACAGKTLGGCSQFQGQKGFDILRFVSKVTLVDIQAFRSHTFRAAADYAYAAAP